MKKSYYIHLMLLLFIFCSVQTGPRLVLFFQPEPLTDAERIGQKLRKPGKLAKYTAKGMVQPSLIEGIIATYSGYVNASDYNGELSFPRKHQKNNVHVIVTPEIVPVPLFENTILHWRRIPGVPAIHYQCETIYDEKAKELYWHIREVTLSEDMTIPLAAVVIVAKPKNIRMSLEKMLTNETANLVLPQLYVKKGINTIQNSLYMLTIRHLFKPVETEEKREPLSTVTHIVD